MVHRAKGEAQLVVAVDPQMSGAGMRRREGEKYEGRRCDWCCDLPVVGSALSSYSFFYDGMIGIVSVWAYLRVTTPC